MSEQTTYTELMEMVQFVDRFYGSGNITDKLKDMDLAGSNLKDQLYDFERSRRNFTVKFPNLSAKAEYTMVEKGKIKRPLMKRVWLEHNDKEAEIQDQVFNLSKNAMRQYFASRSGHTYSYAMWNSIRDFPDHEGYPVPLKFLMFDEVNRTRSRLPKIFREATFDFTNDKILENGDAKRVVCGIVGEDYPIAYSDYGLVNAVDNALNDVDIKTRYSHSSKNANGDVRFAWEFTDNQFVDDLGELDDYRRARGARIAKGDRGMGTGIDYYNNWSGQGTLDFGLYKIKYICINGQIIKSKAHIAWGMAHRSEKTFIQEIIDKLITMPKEIGKDFADKYSFQLPAQMTPNWYLDQGNTWTRLYQDMATALILRVINFNEKLQEKYSTVNEMIIIDWRNELAKTASAFGWSAKELQRVETVAVRDPTIRLDPQVKEADYSSVIDAITSTANYYNSVGNTRKSIQYQTIGGSLLNRAKPITKLVEITT